MDNSITASCNFANCYCISMALSMFLQVCKKRIVVRRDTFARWSDVKQHVSAVGKIFGWSASF
jgi:hypothetical protein